MPFHKGGEKWTEAWRVRHPLQSSEKANTITVQLVQYQQRQYQLGRVHSAEARLDLDRRTKRGSASVHPSRGVLFLLAAICRAFAGHLAATAALLRCFTALGSSGGVS